MKRQRALLGATGPRLVAVVDRTALDVAALPGGIAGPRVMRKQIKFLNEAAGYRTSRIQILPPGAAARVGIGTAFSLLRLPLPLTACRGRACRRRAYRPSPTWSISMTPSSWTIRTRPTATRSP